MPFCKQKTNRWLTNCPILASKDWLTFIQWLVLPEMQVMQIGQLVVNLTDRLVTRNPTLEHEVISQLVSQ